MTGLRRTTRTVGLPPAREPLAEMAAREAGLRLADFIARHPRLLVLTGAGVSTDSGIPDYRDHQGAWKRRQPVQHQEFMTRADVRRRYWGRSLLGWPLVRQAQPNPAHECIAAVEELGYSRLVVTQNVDRLHQRAGTRDVLDLHGRIDKVVCMACSQRFSRDWVQHHSGERNPRFLSYTAEVAPDGDADLEVGFDDFEVVDCPDCAGILKPDVVFFGDFVPGDRVERVRQRLADSDGLLVIGSSLMVYSGLRFCREARKAGKAVASLNLGRTRADDLLSLRLNARIAESLKVCLEALRR